jgi:serine/threonine-protein kinase
MGYVELCFRRDGRFLRWCARKRLHAHFREDISFRSMFVDEARLAGLVRHPNVVGVSDVGEDDDGPYLIMDYVEGVSLSRAIREAGAPRSIPMQVAVRICRDVATGLHAAHEVRSEDGTALRLVHRDVSPQNVLIGFDGTVRVTDFGIAKALGNASQTNAGVLKGNMGYLSPEQLQFQEPDRRSDFFSLGVTLYELLSGERLYPNTDGFDGTRRILTEPPPDIGEVRNDVPADLVELLFEMLSKDRVARPTTAAEIAGRLEGTLASLIAEEGSITVADYMDQNFAAQREQHRRFLAEHVKRLDAESAPAPPIFAPHAPRPGLAVGGRGRWRWLAVAACAVAATAALATAHRRASPMRPGAPIVAVPPAAPAAPATSLPVRAVATAEAAAPEADTRRDAAAPVHAKRGKRPPGRRHARLTPQHEDHDKARVDETGQADAGNLAVPLFTQWR